jgi:hypothetical protein
MATLTATYDRRVPIQPKVATASLSTTSMTQQELINLIWSIANKLRGPYRPPQYRKVMIPLTVLRRLDCVLEPTKDKVLAEYKDLKC